MKTQLSKFCEDFEALVAPVLGPLSAAAKTLEATSEKLNVRGVLPQIHETRHRLRSLAEKVAEQQAYVLIFGPLKSGKSTLMNAIAAAYVSEVTALPAYPCMVYVSHAPERKFTITHYNGEEESFTDLGAMQTLMEFAHAELAKRLREVEAQGEAFDPLEHMPAAIRRVDVRLPAQDLKQSSAVLVDTPGLYSRMRFGYDRMTRDFRDSAACAVFVVKTDNLFLEQVFDEFEELLELFSRIFLVVNIDTTKRDLQPDGDLGPSLENTDPKRIIEAFENLAMSAPLKRAAESGRLRIFPVDLLHAASSRVRHEKPPLVTSPLPLEFAVDESLDDGEGSPFHSRDSTGSSPSKERASGIKTVFAAMEGDVHDASFDPFLEGLTEYLNSTDYMVAFLGDSLRQATGILGEVEAVGQEPRVLALPGEIEELRTEARHCDDVEQALTTLETVDWPQSFAQLGTDLVSITRGRVQELQQKTLDRMIDGVDRWTESSGSFQDLTNTHIRPVIENCRKELAEAGRGVFETVAGNRTAGATFDGNLGDVLDALGLHMGHFGTDVVAELKLEEALGSTRLAASPESIPLRKSFFDWILLRGQTKIRRRVFGPDSAPTQPISKADKLRRLGQAGFAALADLLQDALLEFFEQAARSLEEVVLRSYVQGVETGVRGLCGERRAANDDLRERLQRELSELEAARWRLDQLLHTNQTAQTRLDELSRKYGQTAPEELVLAVEESMEEESPPGLPEDPGEELQLDEVIGERFGGGVLAELTEDDEPVVELQPIAPLGSAPESAPEPETTSETTGTHSVQNGNGSGNGNGEHGVSHDAGENRL